MALSVMKMSNGTVIINENGRVSVIRPPAGVSYQKEGNCISWKANVLTRDVKSKSKSEWTTISTTFKTKGILEAFFEVVERRKKSVGFLLNQRMLPRMRKGDPVAKLNGEYRVFDPFENVIVSLPTRNAAIDFNNDIIDRYIDNHEVHENELVEAM